MSSEPRDSSSDVDKDESEGSDSTSQLGDTETSPGLKIALPDGSASVADAILTNREMLRNPQDHEIATEEDITHLSEAMESLSGKVETTNRKFEEREADVTELQNRVEQQQRQITELQSMVTSLAEILGTEAEWEEFDED